MNGSTERESYLYSASVIKTAFILPGQTEKSRGRLYEARNPSLPNNVIPLRTCGETNSGLARTNG